MANCDWKFLEIFVLNGWFDDVLRSCLECTYLFLLSNFFISLLNELYFRVLCVSLNTRTLRRACTCTQLAMVFLRVQICIRYHLPLNVLSVTCLQLQYNEYIIVFCTNQMLHVLSINVFNFFSSPQIQMKILKHKDGFHKILTMYTFLDQNYATVIHGWQRITKNWQELIRMDKNGQEWTRMDRMDKNG